MSQSFESLKADPDQYIDDVMRKYKPRMFKSTPELDMEEIAVALNYLAVRDHFYAKDIGAQALEEIQDFDPDDITQVMMAGQKMMSLKVDKYRKQASTLLDHIDDGSGRVFKEVDAAASTWAINNWRSYNQIIAEIIGITECSPEDYHNAIGHVLDTQDNLLLRECLCSHAGFNLYSTIRRLNMAGTSAVGVTSKNVQQALQYASGHTELMLPLVTSYVGWEVRTSTEKDFDRAYQNIYGMAALAEGHHPLYLVDKGLDGIHKGEILQAIDRYASTGQVKGALQ